MKLTQAIIYDPYTLFAARANVRNQVLTIELTSTIQVVIPIVVLGEPWTKASNKQFDEGLVLDEVLPAMLGFKPASMLARLGRGTSTPKKAAAVRLNGRNGGRAPKKVAIRKAAALR